jgi:hypothetical protein
MNFGPVWDGYFLTASLIGFAAGTAISVLLLVLTVRAAKVPGTPVANILFAACALVWNVGGLACAGMITTGAPQHGLLERTLFAIQFTSAAVWPIPLLAIWKPLAFHSWQRKGCLALQALAMTSGVVIVILLWIGAFGGMSEKALILQKEATSYNATILLCMGIALFRNRLASRTMWLPLTAILAGVLGATLAIVISEAFVRDPAVCTVMHVASEQSTLLIVLGAFFLLTRFRFSDLFIRFSIRVLLATLTAVAFFLIERLPFLLGFEEQTAYPQATRVFLETSLAVILLFAFAYLDGILRTHIERWVFRAPDYRNLVRHVSERLAGLHIEREIAGAAEDAARDALSLNAVLIIAIESLPRLHRHEAISDGAVVEVDSQDPLRASLH